MLQAFQKTAIFNTIGPKIINSLFILIYDHFSLNHQDFNDKTRSYFCEPNTCLR